MGETSRLLALALAIPVFVALLVLELEWNMFVTRFLLVPVVLTAALLLAGFSGGRAAVAALSRSWRRSSRGRRSSTTRTKSLAGPGPALGHLTQARALEARGGPAVAQAALPAFERFVPAQACVGAMLGPDEPAYLLGAAAPGYRSVYLSVDRPAVHEARAQGPLLRRDLDRGEPVCRGAVQGCGLAAAALGKYWLLASEPEATTGEC